MSHGCPLTVPTRRKLKRSQVTFRSPVRKLASLAKKPVIQENKPTTSPDNSPFKPNGKLSLDDEYGKRIEVVLVSSSRLTRPLSSPMQRVWERQMLWEPGNPPIWTLHVHDVPSSSGIDGGGRGSGGVGIIENDLREELKEKICGRGRRTRKHQSVSFWEKKSKGRYHLY
ncbi:unnamed protein product [Pleuronectes platessa]|uniref:Uncharacterized protein n=1 Tax=Pleuronectes platessa TaxID=8262 RepID=A0A9N7VN03_PLEPL|nr:unnamed protein product [Pleuronectes platessa]